MDGVSYSYELSKHSLFRKYSRFKVMFHELAFQIAKKAHLNKWIKQGKDYILHPMKVASYMDTDTEKAVAYLHDVLEDTNVTEDELRNMFSNEIVDTVIILTHRKDESYLNIYLEYLHQS